MIVAVVLVSFVLFVSSIQVSMLPWIKRSKKDGNPRMRLSFSLEEKEDVQLQSQDDVVIYTEDMEKAFQFGLTREVQLQSPVLLEYFKTENAPQIRYRISQIVSAIQEKKDGLDSSIDIRDGEMFNLVEVDRFLHFVIKFVNRFASISKSFVSVMNIQWETMRTQLNTLDHPDISKVLRSRFNDENDVLDFIAKELHLLKETSKMLLCEEKKLSPWVHQTVYDIISLTHFLYRVNDVCIFFVEKRKETVLNEFNQRNEVYRIDPVLFQFALNFEDLQHFSTILPFEFPADKLPDLPVAQIFEECMRHDLLLGLYTTNGMLSTILNRENSPIEFVCEVFTALGAFMPKSIASPEIFHALQYLHDVIPFDIKLHDRIPPLESYLSDKRDREKYKKIPEEINAIVDSLENEMLNVLRSWIDDIKSRLTTGKETKILPNQVASFGDHIDKVLEWTNALFVDELFRRQGKIEDAGGILYEGPIDMFRAGLGKIKGILNRAAGNVKDYTIAKVLQDTECLLVLFVKFADGTNRKSRFTPSFSLLTGNKAALMTNSKLPGKQSLQEN